MTYDYCIITWNQINGQWNIVQWMKLDLFILLTGHNFKDNISQYNENMLYGYQDQQIWYLSFHLTTFSMDQADEDFNYDRQYRTMCTGLGSFLSSAQDNGDIKEKTSELGDCNSTAITMYSTDELSKRKKTHIQK